MRTEAKAFFDPIDLTGKSLIDIGAWNGGHSVEAKRRGAGRVVAADCDNWNNLALRGRERSSSYVTH